MKTKIQSNTTPPAFEPFDVIITVESERERAALKDALRHYGVRHARMNYGADIGEKLVEASLAIREAR
jgi:hypothetical protein